MKAKTKKPARTKAQSNGKATDKKSSKSQLVPSNEAPAALPGSDQSRFVNDLLVRGEAAKLTPDGKLPLRATHIVEKQNKDGSAVVRRARFKLF
jgi:hypothetical protein